MTRKQYNPNEKVITPTGEVGIIDDIDYNPYGFSCLEGPNGKKRAPATLRPLYIIQVKGKDYREGYFADELQPAHSRKNISNQDYKDAFFAMVALTKELRTAAYRRTPLTVEEAGAAIRGIDRIVTNTLTKGMVIT